MLWASMTFMTQEMAYLCGSLLSGHMIPPGMLRCSYFGIGVAFPALFVPPSVCHWLEHMQDARDSIAFEVAGGKHMTCIERVLYCPYHWK